MARLVTSGAEIYVSTTEVSSGPDGASVTGGTTNTRDTAVKRTGSASFKLVTTAVGSTGYNEWDHGVDTTCWHRVYFRGSTPTSECSIIRVSDSVNTAMAEVRLNTNGTIELWVWTGGAWAQQGSASAQALDNDTSFYMIQLKVTQSGTAGADEAELILENTTVALWTGTLTSTSNVRYLRAGWVTAPGAASLTCYLDDVAVNSTTGSDQNSWPNEGKVVLLKPISDSQDGSWRGGADSTGIDLSLAVTSTPPAGSNAGSNTTTIESIDSSGNNTTDEYRANLTTYSTAGIVATDFLKVLQPWVNHGEQSATNSKTGAFGLQANPAAAGGGGETTFSYGDDAGASGTWPTGWKWKVGTVAYNPSVTLGSSPVLAVRKTDTGTRVAQVDFMGVYGDYTVGPTEAETRERTQMLKGMAYPEPHSRLVVR